MKTSEKKKKKKFRPKNNKKKTGLVAPTAPAIT